MVKIEDFVFHQERAVEIINVFIRKESIPNLIFYGPDGVGKRRAALIASSMITGDSLERIKKGSSTNVRIVLPRSDGKKNLWRGVSDYYDVDQVADIPPYNALIKIDMVREIIEELTMHPVADRKRVVIILYADRITPEATAALLKILEEPPEDTVFILTTSRIYRLPGTILSRCEKVRFRVLNEDVIRKILRLKGFEEDEEAIFMSEGSIKKAINLIRRKDTRILRISINLVKKAPYGYREIIKAYHELYGEPLDSLLESLILIYRYIYLYKEGLIHIPSRLNEIVDYKSGYLMKREVVKVIEELMEFKNFLTLNPTKKLFIFNLLKTLI